MRSLCLVVLTAAAAVVTAAPPGVGSPAEAEAFAAYQRRHGKAYTGGAAEVALRLANFRASQATVEAHNALPGVSFKMGLNQFSDMSDEEFESKVLMEPQDCSATEGRIFAQAPAAGEVDLPAHVDWREKGVISEVKNQGHCGSCWTFSTVGCLEAHLALKYDAWRAPRLSEQQLVECAQDYDNHGCNGGLPSHAFEYVRGAGGLSTEFSYPYKGVDGKCRFNKSTTPETAPFQPSSMGVGVEVPGGAVNITQGDEAALKYYLATRGPVSVAFQVASDFRHYASGVYTSTVCKSGAKDVNHAVLAIGYGTDPVSGLEYWTIKNSWDYSFGMEGFFKIEAMKNMCGIANCNAFPDLYSLNAMQRQAQAAMGPSAHLVV
mmetsp:Transcript_99086/g.212269  ORF Transcript_99086/g.212269 Transcript_99086/m.212269 type:complete len:377 (+) Transcript_99086:83-1213(+)